MAAAAALQCAAEVDETLRCTPAHACARLRTPAHARARSRTPARLATSFPTQPPARPSLLQANVPILDIGMATDLGFHHEVNEDKAMIVRDLLTECPPEDSQHKVARARRDLPWPALAFMTRSVCRLTSPARCRFCPVQRHADAQRDCHQRL